MKRSLWVVVLALATACATTSTKTQWTSPELGKDKVHDVLVVALMPDEGQRRVVEDAMAANLQETGVEAEQSYHYVSDGSSLTKDEIRTLAERQGNDGILVVRFAGRRQEVVADSMAFDPYWGVAYPLAYDPSYVYTEDIVTLDSRLFGETGNLLWSASSESFDPTDTRKLADSIAGEVTKNLQDHGALAAAPSEPNKG